MISVGHSHRVHSLGRSFDQPLHHASLMVFQQREVKAVLVGASAAPTIFKRLHLHQRAVGMVKYHETLGSVKEKEGEVGFNVH